MEEVPVVFAAPRGLRALNVVAVATSLAACTSTAFMLLLPPREWTWALVAGLPTLLCGALWAVALRWRKTTKTGVRYGWLLSLPLAALNGAFGGGAFVALVSGVSAMWIARVREQRRRRFVARVEASEVPGFRVEKGTLGKVLLRVVSPVPHYRIADVAEELFELDESGSVTHPVQTI